MTDPLNKPKKNEIHIEVLVDTYQDLIYKYRSHLDRKSDEIRKLKENRQLLIERNDRLDTEIDRLKKRIDSSIDRDEYDSIH